MDKTTCQVWWAAPDLARSWHEELLTPAEAGRVERLLRDADRRRLIVGNALLRLTVAEATGSFQEIDRTCPDCGAPHGKPRVVGHDLYVSVSHSGARIAVALTRAAEVGVDVEEIGDRNTADLVRMVLSPDEDPDAWTFHDRWARKEAVLKALGQGLRTPMTSITLDGDTAVGIECQVHRLNAGPGYAAALALLTTQPVTVSEVDGSDLLA